MKHFQMAISVLVFPLAFALEEPKNENFTKNWVGFFGAFIVLHYLTTTFFGLVQNSYIR